MNVTQLHSYNLVNIRTYALAALFVIGNIFFPQLAHLIPQGGFIFLPIYFFTLIAAYRYGIHVGMLTAVLSPVVNNLLFGMPPSPVLLPILIKSGILAMTAALFANIYKKVALLPILFSIIAYQLIGTLIEWIIIKDFYLALSDLRIGIPGIAIQLFGGYLLLKVLSKSNAR